MKQKKENSNIVVGLDLSLTSTGVVVLCGNKIVEQKVVRSSPVGPLPVDEAKRLSSITDQILALVPDNAELVAIEGIAFMISKTTALVQLAAINFIVRIGLWKRGIKFIIVSPPTLKKFVTGKGVAKKDIMMLETYKRWGESLTDNNICDAYGLARISLAILSPDDIMESTQKEVLSLLRKQV